MRRNTHNRHRPLGIRTVAGGAGLALVGALGLGFVDGWRDGTGIVAEPKDSRVNAKVIKVVSDFEICTAKAVVNNEGSAARVKFAIKGQKIMGTGWGAEMERGKAVLTACAKKVRTQATPGEINPATNTRQQTLDVYLSSMVFNGQFSESPSDMKIVSKDPPLSQAGDALTKAQLAACRIVTLGKADAACDAMSPITKWNEDKQAKLEQSLKVRVLEVDQAECGPTVFDSIKAATVDAFRQQVADQKLNPYDLKVRFVDDSGMETNALPDFAKDSLDALRTEGVLSPDKGMEIMFERGSTSCSMETTYQPLFPDKTTESPL